VNVDANVVGLVMLFIAMISGLILFAIFASQATGTPRAIEAGPIAMHGGVAAVVIALWFAFTTTPDGELGGIRGFALVLLAVVLVAGIVMLGTINKARKDDPGGDEIPEAMVNPLHIAGHVFVGSLAIIAVVVAAIIT